MSIYNYILYLILYCLRNLENRKFYEEYCGYSTAIYLLIVTPHAFHPSIISTISKCNMYKPTNHNYLL